MNGYSIRKRTSLLVKSILVMYISGKLRSSNLNVYCFMDLPKAFGCVAYSTAYKLKRYSIRGHTLLFVKDVLVNR